MNPGSMVDGKNAQSRPRPWQLRLTCDTRGVPVDEEVLWQGDWQLGEMEIADFGTLIFQFLRLPHLTPRIDRYGLVLWPLLDNEDYPKDSASLVAIQEEQARMRQFIETYLSWDSQDELLSPYPPRARLVVDAARGATNVGYLSGRLERVWPWFWFDSPATVKQVTDRLRKHAEALTRRRLPPDKVILGTGAFEASMTSLQWGYASDDVASLVWLELLLCAAHNFYWRKCEMCGREELTRSKRRSRFCRECRDSGGFAAQYQRQRREALPETVKANRRAVNRDRMRLLRGDISPEEFLRQHPGYRAREGSELFEILQEARRKQR